MASFYDVKSCSPGTIVAVIGRPIGATSETVTFSKIIKFDKSSLTLEDGSRWVRSSGNRWGDGSGWRSFKDFLMSESDGHQRVAYVKQEAERRATSGAIRAQIDLVNQGQYRDKAGRTVMILNCQKLIQLLTDAGDR